MSLNITTSVGAGYWTGNVTSPAEVCITSVTAHARLPRPKQMSRDGAWMQLERAVREKAKTLGVELDWETQESRISERFQSVSVNVAADCKVPLDVAIPHPRRGWPADGSARQGAGEPLEPGKPLRLHSTR